MIGGESVTPPLRSVHLEQVRPDRSFYASAQCTLHCLAPLVDGSVSGDVEKVLCVVVSDTNFTDIAKHGDGRSWHVPDVEYAAPDFLFRH